MDVNELLSEQTLQRFKNKEATNEEKSSLSDLAKKVLFKDLDSSCSNCYFDAIIELRLFKKRNPKEFEERMNGRHYVLKRGCVFQMGFGSRNMLVRQNCTDKLAIEFLSWDKNNIVHFEDYPEDWEDEVDKYLEAKSNKQPKTSK